MGNTPSNPNEVSDRRYKQIVDRMTKITPNNYIMLYLISKGFDQLKPYAPKDLHESYFPVSGNTTNNDIDDAVFTLNSMEDGTAAKITQHYYKYTITLILKDSVPIGEKKWILIEQDNLCSSQNAMDTFINKLNTCLHSDTELENIVNNVSLNITNIYSPSKFIKILQCGGTISAGDRDDIITYFTQLHDIHIGDLFDSSNSFHRGILLSQLIDVQNIPITLLITSPIHTRSKSKVIKDDETTD